MTDYPENERTIVMSVPVEAPAWHRAIAWLMVWAAGIMLAVIFGRVIIETLLAAAVLCWMLFIPLLHGYLCQPAQAQRYRIGGR